MQKTTPHRILEISCKFEVIIAFSTYMRMHNYLFLKKMNNKFREFFENLIFFPQNKQV